MIKRTCPPLNGSFSVSPTLDNSLTFCNNFFHFLYESKVTDSLFINSSRNQETDAVMTPAASPS
jgi:hypothetical protein